MSNIKNLRIACAAIIIISFFLPWISILGYSLPGYKILDIAGGFTQIMKSLDSPGNDKVILFLFPYLIPILSLITILIELASTTKRSNFIAFLAGVAPFILLFYGVSKMGNDIFQLLSIGSYLTLISAFVLIIVGVKSGQIVQGHINDG